MVTVVTGASGFLGGAVVRALLEQDREVRAIDLHRGPTLDGLDIEFVRGDVLDPERLLAAFDGADAVYHLVALISIAGDPTGQVRRINVDGVRNVAEASLESGVRRMVHCSSVHAYDLETGGKTVIEESARATAPQLPAYDRSKAAGESALRKVVDRGLDAVVVNPTGIIGPDDFAPSRTGQLFQAMFTGKLPALIKGGFDWVDSRDVASSILAADSHGRTGENYLLPGHACTIAQLAALAEEVSGTPKPKVTVPMGLAKIWSPIGDRLSRRSGSALTFTSESLHVLEHNPPISGDKARQVLGHDPRPIEDTVADIYRWFEQRGTQGESPLDNGYSSSS